jgi:hypothetical protein
MPWKTEVFEQLLRQKLRHTRNSYSRSTDFFVALEERLVGSIEYEQWVDVQTEEA